MKNPTDVARKWSQNLAGSGESIRLGVEAVTESPGVAAARNKAGYLAGVNRSVDKWAARVGAVSVEDWRRATLDKGLPRVASGAQAAEPKMATFMGELLPYVDAGRSRIKAMPKASIEDSKQRAVAWIDYMSRFRGRR